MVPESNDIIQADSAKSAEPPQTSPRPEDAAIAEPAPRNDTAAQRGDAPSAAPADRTDKADSSPLTSEPSSADTGAAGARATSDVGPAPSQDAARAETHEVDHGDEHAAVEGAHASEGEADATSGAAQAESEAPGAAGTPGAKTKKRRRRRRGKKSHPPETTAGITAEGSAPQEQSADAAPTANAESKPSQAPRDKGKGKSRREKRGKRKSHAPHAEHAPPRERTAFHVGEEVFGKVTAVTEHAIMVDLSGKALAIFDRHELAEDDLVPETGDRFVAHVHGDGSRGGLVVLTRKPLREEETKARLEEASKSGEPVLGLVTGTVKGGIEVDVDGVRAFAPGSHVDLRPGADLAHLIGHRLEFTVAQYAKRGRDVVVSRKNYIEAEAKEHRRASLAKLEIGSIVKGIVRSVVQYGAFVAIPSADDVEGLVHMTEASHDRGAKLSDVFQVGAEIDVKVLRVDDKDKLWLSHKAATVDPWQEAMKTYGPGTRHRGKVMRLLPFGAFIELAPGIEGLLHTQDLSFKRIEHPKDVLKENEEIDVVVADLERGTKKIALHLAPPPGEENEPKQRVVPHKGLKVAVVAAETAGLVVRVLGLTGRHARGFIPAGHTGTERGTDLRKHFPPGTRLEAKVIEIDPRRGEAKLSLRALREDSEKAAYNEYRASVAKASKFGTLGDLIANATKKR
jgi:small subunit ribosomal protein S1